MSGTTRYFRYTLTPRGGRLTRTTSVGKVRFILYFFFWYFLHVCNQHGSPFPSTDKYIGLQYDVHFHENILQQRAERSTGCLRTICQTRKSSFYTRNMFRYLKKKISYALSFFVLVSKTVNALKVIKIILLKIFVATRISDSFQPIYFPQNVRVCLYFSKQVRIQRYNYTRCCIIGKSTQIQ